MIIAFAAKKGERGGGKGSFLLRICGSIVFLDREKKPQPNSTPPPTPLSGRSTLAAVTRSARSRNKAGRCPGRAGSGTGPPRSSAGLEKNTETPGPTARGNREVKHSRGFFFPKGWWEKGFAKLELSAEGAVGGLSGCVWVGEGVTGGDERAKFWERRGHGWGPGVRCMSQTQ